jgi:hypothetical protein
MVVLDHLGDALVLCQWHAQRAQAKTALATVLQQAQRHGRQQQTLQHCRGQARASRQIVQAGRGVVQGTKQVQPHATQQHLAVHKTGHQVEQLAGAAAREPACEGVAQRPLVQPRVCVPALQTRLPGVLERTGCGVGLQGGQIQGLRHGTSFACGVLGAQCAAPMRAGATARWVLK